jgi:hypothetical protein
MLIHMSEHMIHIKYSPVITRTTVVDVLAQLRQEWEMAVEQEDLVDVQGSIGLLLLDIVIGLRLQPFEQIQVLGSKLHSELQSILVVIPENGKGN